MIDEINNYDRGKIIEQAKSLQDLTSHSGARRWRELRDPYRPVCVWIPGSPLACPGMTNLRSRGRDVSKGAHFPSEEPREHRPAIGTAHPPGHEPSVDPPSSVLLRAGLRPRDEAADLRVVSHRHAADFLRGPRQRRAGAGDRPAGPRRLVDHPVGATAATSISPPAPAAWRVDLDTLRGGAARRFRRGRDAREGHGRRRDGHHRAVGERPLVGGAGQGRPGDALRPDRHRAEDVVGVPRARHHRPSAVLPGRRRPHPLCRAADRPGLGDRPQRREQPPALCSAKTACSGSPTRSGCRAAAPSRSSTGRAACG